MSGRAEVDVLVIGAGPAGSAAAIACARAGVGVLMVERCVFPRPKVCGGCVSPAGMREARALGVRGVDGVALEEIELRACGRRAGVGVAPGGVAVARERFDALLMEHARWAGACVSEGVHAVVERAADMGADVLLREHAGQRSVRARVVVGADGLGGACARALAPARVSAWSRVGVGARAPGSVVGNDVPVGRIVMHCARGGYVGMVRLRDGTLDIGAALSPAMVREAGGPGPSVRRVLEHAGGADARWAMDLAWKGTAALTRRRRARAGCVFLAGDSAGYVEPFTGEGISWALRTGALAGDLAARVVRGEAGVGEWDALHRAVCVSAHRRCLLWTRAMRMPGVMSLGVRGVGAVPMVGGVVRALVGGAWSRAT